MSQPERLRDLGEQAAVRAADWSTATRNHTPAEITGDVATVDAIFGVYCELRWIAELLARGT